MGNNSTERRVVVTGLGIVSPLGNDISTFWDNLVAGQCGVDRISSFDPSKFDTQIAAEVKNFDPLPAFPSPKEVRRADRFGQFGVYAGWKAVHDPDAHSQYGIRPILNLLPPARSQFCDLLGLRNVQPRHW